jgi:putative ABC transport system permease protein
VIRLFIALILRPLRQDILRTSLTVLAVALGVGVVIAIELAGDAAGGSFESSLKSVTGKVDLEIIANGGLDERITGKLAKLPINAKFCPILQIQPLYYAVDPFSCARDFGQPGGEAKPNPITIRGRRVQPLAKMDDHLILDIADAQYLFESYGRLDRIDIFLSPRQNFDAAEKEIRAALPAGYELTKPGARSDENRRMLRAFRWNLRVLSYISLVVGAFLIYNTISISVVRRRTEIGILRALGTSRAAVSLLFLSEAVLLGLAGSALGLVFGRLMAQATVGLISQTVSALYTSSRPGAIELTWLSGIEAIAAGTLVAVFSATAPAREAMGVTPAEAMSRGSREHEAHLHVRRDAVIAGCLAVLALIASRGEPVDGKPVWGYLATLLSIGVAGFLSPIMVLGIVRGLRGVVRRLFKAPGLLAGRSLTASLARTSIVVGALATAIAMMISVAIMVGSFRETLILWLDTQLRADLYVAPAGPSGAGVIPPLPREVPRIAAQVPGVADTDVLYAMEFHYGPDRASLGGIDTAVLLRYGHLRFLSGEGNHDAVLASLPGRDRVIISEPFANKHGVHTGDTLELNLGAGRRAFHIAGVYYDYSSDRGFVMLDRSTLLKYLPDRPPTNLAIYVERGANVDEVRQRVRDALAGYGVNIAPNAALRRAAVVVFDRTFAITWALEGVAILVAMLGAANSLLALVLDRRRDLGLLQYLGAAGGQVRSMILVEAGFIGLMASALGLALGSALSLLLIYVINKQSFGWTIQFHPPFTLVGSALLLVWSFTVLAGLYPARVASRLNPIEVIHEE